MPKPNLTIVSAVNNQRVLESCLLASPEISPATEVLLLKGYQSAVRAYNHGLTTARNDLVMFVHQDVFLPAGWLANLEAALRALSVEDPNWGVIGIWGVNRNAQFFGHLHCTASRKTLGSEFNGVCEVRALDEVVLIVRKSSNLRFDESLPGFHLYASDLCLEAEKRGMRNYAISAFCIHNSNGYGVLPWQFWKSFFYLRRKWKDRLPIVTPCVQVTSWCLPVLWRNMIRRSAEIVLRRHNPGKRVADPKALYAKLFEANQVGKALPDALH